MGQILKAEQYTRLGHQILAERNEDHPKGRMEKMYLNEQLQYKMKY